MTLELIKSYHQRIPIILEDFFIQLTDAIVYRILIKKSMMNEFDFLVILLYYSFIRLKFD